MDSDLLNRLDTVTQFGVAGHVAEKYCIEAATVVRRLINQLEMLRDEMKLISLAVGRSKTDGESDCDWHDLAGDVIHLKSTAKRLTEMVGAAYTAGWMAGYSTGGTLEDESETNLDWYCGEDWVQDGLRPELLQIIESV